MADAGQLERLLGKDWQTLGFIELDKRARSLETAAGFARTLTICMLAANHGQEDRNGLGTA